MTKNTKASKGCSGGLRLGRLGLVMWKNLQYRKRHFILTSFEILFPVLMVFILVYQHFYNGPHRYKSIYQPKIVQGFSIADLGQDFKPCGYLCSSHILAFYPQEAKDIIDELVRELETVTPTSGRPAVVFQHKPFDSVEELEAFVTEKFRQNDLKDVNKPSSPALDFVASIIFTKGFTPGKTDVNPEISYTIRLRADSHNSIDTDELYNFKKFESESSYEDHNWYMQSGFTLLQLILDNYIIQNAAKSTAVGIPDVHVAKFPYMEDWSSSWNDPFGGQTIFFCGLVAGGFLAMVPSIVLLAVSEKKSGIKELMKIMGLPNWIHWLGWMLNSMILHIITVSLIVFLLAISLGDEAKPLLAHSDPFFMWISFYLYIMSGIAFCLFISTLFQTPIVAIIVGFVVWIISFFATAFTVDPQNHIEFTISDVLPLALIPNYALFLLMGLTFKFEKEATGAQFAQLAEPLNSEMPLSLGYVWLMFLVDAILYLALAVYLENVLPSEFGVRKPWYYPFWPSCFSKLRLSSFRKQRAVQVQPVINSGPENTTGFEAEPTGLNAGIIITNLSKQYGQKRKAVNNLSLKMFDGQITALLGHNGAGKTTTMSILTGMFSPTSGTATVNGFDIRTQMDKVRNSLGLCPQHNLLFEKLNARQHLMFFGYLKGLSWRDAKSEASNLLQLVGMPEKAKVVASKLSGGQKRKLCLCMALIGGTKVLILDEPTSGMDPQSRRAIWDVLLSMRGSRTILLSTHFMDEADVLGDRIAIMAVGKLQCCGSPEYLKRFYGTGFTLSMTIDPIADKNAIMSLVQKHSPEASWKYKKFSTNSELGITLPSKEGSASDFSPLLSDLTKKKLDLGVQSIGLTMTTMDDVFVKVGELVEGEDAENYEAAAVQTGGESAPKSEGCCGLVLLRFWALFLKRVLYTWRKKDLFIAQFATPLLLLLFAVLIANKSFVAQNLNPPRKLTMKISDYKNPITLYTYKPEDGLGKFYKDVVGPSVKLVSNVTGELLNARQKDKFVFQAKYIVAANLTRPTPGSSVTAFYSTFALHAAPLSVNFVSNAILKSLNPGGFIEVSNQPFIVNHINSIQKERAYLEPIAMMYSILVALGFSLFAGFVGVFPIEENICKGKQLQLMSGVNPLIFWGSSFLWDSIMVLILAGLTVVVLSFHLQDVFTTNDAGGVIFLIVLVFGLTIIPFAYVWSLILKTPAGGFAFISTFNALMGILFGVVIWWCERILPVGGAFSVIFRIISSPFPCVAFMITILKYGEIAYGNAECNFIPDKFTEAVCEIVKSTNEPLYEKFYHCCRSCNADVFGGKCHKPLSYLTWSIEDRAVVYKKGSRGELKPIIGILQELFYLSLVSLFYMFLLFMVEFGILGKLKSKAAKGQHDRPSTDEDVKVESQRVQQMIASGQVGQDAFVAGDISKSYGGFAAVSNLSFGVHHGECFGLLGVNGAGKTTAFRILTGDETSSGGNAFAFKLTLKKNKRKFLRNIGYCPQFDAIVGVLTGREMLELFARLRGIQGKYVNSQATLWLKKMGLYESRNQLCKNYSGGMKRRLSAGMALIGEPRIIMLDEPTSGVDPMSRRRFWDVLAEARNSGQSIILTSHSMEECEALCTRLGIMVNGQIQCFGEVEHLKTKFAQGFSLVLKLKPDVLPESPELTALNEEILKKFDPCEIKDQHQNVLQYQITNKTIGWDVLFHQMEDMKTRNEELIEEYSVNETSLENVFLVFARQQYPERVVKVSCWKKCILCQCC